MFKLIKGLEQPRPGDAPDTSVFKAARTVLWSFAGIRKGGEHAKDAAAITPLQVIAIGFAGVALFVVTLVLLVRYITS